MSLFSPPPDTRYDLRFSIAGIPIRVHPLFWLIAVLFGASAGGLLQLIIWVLAVFVSIVIHELGHAFTMRGFGQPSRIVLYFGGGLTVPESAWWGGRSINVSLSPAQEILISLAGPFAGFLFTALILAGSAAVGGSVGLVPLFGVLPFPAVSLPANAWLINDIIATLLWINIFWGLINLVPVYPLDGGNVSRYALLKLDPLNGVDTSLWISIIAGCLLAILGLVLFGSIYIALLFAFLAFQSYQMLRGRTGGWGV